MTVLYAFKTKKKMFEQKYYCLLVDVKINQGKKKMVTFYHFKRLRNAIFFKNSLRIRMYNKKSKNDKQKKRFLPVFHIIVSCKFSML